MIYLGTEEAFDGLFKIKGLINVFGLIALIPMHLYFDILSGVIQTLVFVLLTMIY
jgi:F0F1-type ATP synthase membrane subunit a